MTDVGCKELDSYCQQNDAEEFSNDINAGVSDDFFNAVG
jgi:hypothetical protein